MPARTEIRAIVAAACALGLLGSGIALAQAPRWPDADDIERSGAELRLVIGDELVLLQPGENVVGDALGGDDLGLKRVVEELVAIAATILGAVEGNIGIDKKAQRVGQKTHIGSYADGSANPAFVPLRGQPKIMLSDFSGI